MICYDYWCDALTFRTRRNRRAVQNQQKAELLQEQQAAAAASLLMAQKVHTSKGKGGQKPGAALATLRSVARAQIVSQMLSKKVADEARAEKSEMSAKGTVGAHRLSAMGPMSPLGASSGMEFFRESAIEAVQDAKKAKSIGGMRSLDDVA